MLYELVVLWRNVCKPLQWLKAAAVVVRRRLQGECVEKQVCEEALPATARIYESSTL
jgi:hypothetical protein